MFSLAWYFERALWFIYYMLIISFPVYLKITFYVFVCLFSSAPLQVSSYRLTAAYREGLSTIIRRCSPLINFFGKFFNSCYKTHALKCYLFHPKFSKTLVRASKTPKKVSPVASFRSSMNKLSPPRIRFGVVCNPSND